MMTDAEIDIAFKKEKDVRRKERLHAVRYVVRAKKKKIRGAAWLMRRAHNAVK